MTGSIAKVMMLSVALTLAVPESYAKRVGGGRSVGRATPPSAMRQRSAPPQRAPSPPPQSARAPAAPAGPVAPAAPVQRTQPDVARQSVPAAPVPPANRTLPRQASSPWGGMLGGALIGLGLGSLIGANQHRDPAQQPPVQSEGGNGNGDEAATGSNSNSASNGDPSQAGSAQMAPAEQTQSRFGSALLVGLAGLAIFFMMRRRRNRQRGF
jgi:MYXO-CTERM domain-containing protein